METRALSGHIELLCKEERDGDPAQMLTCSVLSIPALIRDNLA